jgi:ADP-ribosylglycohydrolase
MSGTLSAIVDGLMLGESLAWTGLYQRSHLLPFWTRRKRREIEADYERDGLIETSLPFALNQPTGAFRLAPGAHCEWLAFQAELLLAGGGTYSQELALEAWRALVPARESLRLTVGQHAVLANLERGAMPPQSGHDNPHYFDDGACFRAVPLLVARGGEPHELVRLDASITNSEDGVWAAQAYAAALATALATSDPEASVQAALACLPAGSWAAAEAERALAAARGAGSLFELIHTLSDEHTSHAYNYGDSAPETLALTLATVSYTGGGLEAGLLAALALARTAGSVVPLVGGLCGALGAPVNAPARALVGVALPAVRGTDLAALLRRLTELPHEAESEPWTHDPHH